MHKPKIGVRPTVDGRRNGVRESLESSVLKIAHDDAKFLRNNLRYPDGSKVDVVVAPICIGGRAEAAKVDEEFARKGVQVSHTVTPCWCYGEETMDKRPDTFKIVRGVNGTERPGAVYLAAVLAGSAQNGFPAFGIYGQDVQDKEDMSISGPKQADIRKKMLLSAKAGLAAASMQGESYLSIGFQSMGIAGSQVSPEFFSDYLGMPCEFVDMSEISRRIDRGIYDQKEFKKAIKWVKGNCKEGVDMNPKRIQLSRVEKNKQWEYVTKMTMVVRDLMIGNPNLKRKFGEEALGRNAILAGTQGQRPWTDDKPNFDYTETQLNSSFDWNGIRRPHIVATENDSLNGVAMLMGYLLTNTAQIFSDVRTYWSPESIERVTGLNPRGKAEGGIIHLINSGSTTLDGTGQQSDEDGNPVMKPYWQITPEEVERCLKATTFPPAVLEYFRGGGFSTEFITRGEMPVTMSRVNLIKGLGPVLQIAEGYVLNIPKEMQRPLIDRTNPTWPTTWFVPNTGSQYGSAFKDVYSVMNSWGANHGAISYGHIGEELIALAANLRIPVAMHNVTDERIFRPKVWESFGTRNLESADFRACANFGPIYRTVR